MQNDSEKVESISNISNGFEVKNVVINFLGQLIPLIVGVMAIPLVIRGLGIENFGVLSFAWMFLGYFTVFDLGLGRATIKFISEEINRGSTTNLRNLFWTSCLMNFCLGLIGGIIVAISTPFLAESIFRIPLNLVNSTKTTFYILAFSCPIVLISTAFRGTLEAAQRFKYVNTVAAIASSFNFILPIVGVFLGLKIQGVIFLLMIARLCSALAYLFFCFKVFPSLKIGIWFDIKRIKQLVKYGGWVSVSNVVQPVLTYLDRFIIGSIISIAAVAYYTAPFEMVTRLSILPTSLTMILFPMFSSVGVGKHENLTGLYSHSIKFLLLLMGPLVAVLILFAGDILRLWIGLQFSEISTVVFQILAIGVLMNSLAQIPFSLIQGLGYPDIAAKLHLLELLLYIPLMWFFVLKMGIIGGAMAWSIRVSFDSLLLFTASRKYMTLHASVNTGLKSGIAVIIVLIGLLLSLLFFTLTVFVKFMITATILIVFAFIVWHFVLDDKEKDLIVVTSHQIVDALSELVNVKSKIVDEM